MARRTRRPAVVWLPNDRTNRLNLAPTVATNGITSAALVGAISVGANPVSTSVQIFPVVLDEPQGVALATSSLSDVEGSAYRLRRIVGKIFIQPDQTASIVANDPTSFYVTASFIILRVDNTGTALAPLATYDNQALDQIRDPHIWRRSWLLSNLAGVTALNIATVDTRISFFRRDTTEFGSVQDGGHIDAKTARVVSDEERLFLVVTAVPIDGNAQGRDSLLLVVADLRVLASMRKQSGNRRNASR